VDPANGLVVRMIEWREIENFSIAYPDDGAFHRIVFSYNPTNRAVSLQIDNGAPVTGVLTTALDQESGSIPYWLNLEPTAGTILDEVSIWRGVLTTAQILSDWNSGTGTTCTPQVLIITSDSPLAGGQVSVAYDQQLAVTGNQGTVTWTILSGALPDGLAMGSDGHITGTPTVEAAFNFEVQAEDSLHTTSKSFAITIAAAPAGLTVNSNSPVSDYSGCSYDGITCEVSLTNDVGILFTVEGGTGPYVWSITSAPTGAYINDYGDPGGPSISVLFPAPCLVASPAGECVFDVGPVTENITVHVESSDLAVGNGTGSITIYNENGPP
jgi:hypothetical protein